MRCVRVPFVLACCTPALAQTCLTDVGGDGHPLFGNPAIRSSIEGYPNEVEGGKTTGVAFGDIDGDGDADAVLVNNWPGEYKKGFAGYIYVCMNQGDGEFQTPGVDYAAGVEPCRVELADLDDDKDLDIVVTNANLDKLGTISILLNKGNGTFADDVEYPVGLQPRSVKIADVNGDKVPDLTVLNVFGNDVSVLIGKGDGTFQPEARYPVGDVTQRNGGNLTFPYPGPFHAVADLEGDGDLDLAVPCYDLTFGSRIKFLINDGEGGFTLSRSSVKLPQVNPYCIAAGDLNGDGKADLAVVMSALASGTQALLIVLNKGDGSFKTPVGYDVMPEAPKIFETNSVDLADVDGDGDLDVAVGNKYGLGVALMRNHGDGSLAPKEIIQVFKGPWFVRWADLNGDGRPDLGVVTDWARAKLSALLNDGAGGLISHEFNRVATNVWPWVQPWDLAASDLDNDGDPDLAVAVQAPQNPGSIIIVLNDGGNILNAGTAYTLGAAGYSSPEFIAVGDITGDGLPDLLSGTSGKTGYYDGPGTLHLIPSTGDGQFGADQTYPLDGVIPLAAAIGDLDGDGDQDVAVLASEPGFAGHPPRERRVIVFRNDGGVLVQSEEDVIADIPLRTQAGIALGDLDGDLDVDIVAVASNFVKDGPGVLATLKNDGHGAFPVIETLALPLLPNSVVLADTDGDKDLDVTVVCGGMLYDLEPYLIAFRNDGSGALRPVQTDTDPFAMCERAIGADANGDGAMDLVMVHDYGAVMVRLGDGQGGFRPGVCYGAGEEPISVAAVDFDGDGRVDVVTANNVNHNFSLLRNRFCAKKCVADCDSSGTLDIDDFICFQTRFAVGDAKADCDGSGELDIDDFICFQTAFGLGCR